MGTNKCTEISDISHESNEKSKETNENSEKSVKNCDKSKEVSLQVIENPKRSKEDSNKSNFEQNPKKSNKVLNKSKDTEIYAKESNNNSKILPEKRREISHEVDTTLEQRDSQNKLSETTDEIVKNKTIPIVKEEISAETDSIQGKIKSRASKTLHNDEVPESESKTKDFIDDKEDIKKKTEKQESLNHKTMMKKDDSNVIEKSTSTNKQ